MALNVPQIGEFESLRYLLGASNHVGLLSDTSPRNLILKLYSTNTDPTSIDDLTPNFNRLFEPYATTGAQPNGAAVATGYATCINNRSDQNYTENYGILLNGSRWRINTTGTATTATYQEQTFTFSSAAGSVYGYFLGRAQNMPRGVQGVPGVGVGTAAARLTFGTTGAPTIGIVGNSYIDIDSTLNVDTITVGMAATHIPIAGQPIGIKTGTTVVGIDRIISSTNANHRVYLSNAVEQNIQVATGATVGFDFTSISLTDRGTGGFGTHGLVPGDVLYIGAGDRNGTGATGVATGTYTVFSTPTAYTFNTTPALSGTGTCTLYPSVFYAERFTNGPYTIANNGDQIKITLNVSLE